MTLLHLVFETADLMTFIDQQLRRPDWKHTELIKTLASKYLSNQLSKEFERQRFVLPILQKTILMFGMSLVLHLQQTNR